ncbi:MAG: PDZ domain-containing protein [Candidatus Aminicenantes bacterium]|nr:PDZ domain-containing protein [Candidatus Aminicenantes bacterium]
MKQKDYEEKIKLKRIILALILSIVFISGLLYSGPTEDKSLTLPLGPAQYRGKFLETRPGQLFSARKGQPISFDQMIKDLKKVEGLSNLVVQANPTEPLAKSAGFQKGDVILSVEDKSFDDLNEWRMFLAKYNWGSEVKFKVLRNGEVINLTLKLEPELVIKPEKKQGN